MIYSEKNRFTIRIFSRLAWIALLMLAAVPACQATDISEPATGVIPEGTWVLNQERSNKFRPASHTLWVIKDDGHRLVWISAEISPDETVRVTSWDGIYGGEPTEVKGANGMMSTVESPAKGKVFNYGTVPGFGKYSESCEVLDEGKRFRCELTIHSEEGDQTFIEDFDWVSEFPMALP